MSNSVYNSTSLDIVALRITSKPKRKWAVKITNKDVGRGFLEVESYVKVDSIFTIENNMIAKFVGKLNEMKINEVKLKLDELFDVRCRGCWDMIG
jgi:mRNA-degrading endonuclease toxin of MazEF toxin-antitoxin module